mmetsp:Transcript_34960/g.73747  ORF Transcript_34960/g.73747 Transcript_34960/m.73747 type:complete len:171 (-) Transcript_34960:117-629(-)
MKSTSLIVSFFALIPATTSAFASNNNRPQQRLNNNLSHHDKAPQHKTTTELNLYRSAAEAIAEAEQICYMEGPDSQRCKVAWDIVEELKAADAHVRTPDTPANDISYIPLVAGLNILSDKLDRKLGELKNLSTQMAEAGAGPEVERLIYASDEMKQVLTEARAAVSQYSE